jgi:CRP/FNR family transcriptional regulator
MHDVTACRDRFDEIVDVIDNNRTTYQIGGVMAKAAEIFETLQQMQMFSSLTRTELASIMDKISIKGFAKNEVILYEEDTNSCMYMILSGKVKVVQAKEDGKEIILAIHKARDSFGELSMIDCKTSPATVVALEDTTVAMISNQNFHLIVYSQNKILDNVLRMLCHKLRESWGKIQMVNSKNAPQRVSMLFQQLSADHGEMTDEGLRLNLKLTHQVIADMTGLTREAVTRTLYVLQNKGEITIGKNKMIYLRNSTSAEI